jgi:hypothetical protein
MKICTHTEGVCQCIGTYPINNKYPEYLSINYKYHNTLKGGGIKGSGLVVYKKIPHVIIDSPPNEVIGFDISKNLFSIPQEGNKCHSVVFLY